MRKLLFLLFVIVCCHNANGQNLNWAELYEEKNFDTTFRLKTFPLNPRYTHPEYLVYCNYKCYRKDTVFTKKGYKILYKLVIAYSITDKIFLTKTGTKEELEHWAENEYKSTYEEYVEVSGFVNKCYGRRYKLDQKRFRYVTTSNAYSESGGISKKKKSVPSYNI